MLRTLPGAARRRLPLRAARHARARRARRCVLLAVGAVVAGDPARRATTPQRGTGRRRQGRRRRALQRRRRCSRRPRTTTTRSAATASTPTRRPPRSTATRLGVVDRDLPRRRAGQGRRRPLRRRRARRGRAADATCARRRRAVGRRLRARSDGPPDSDPGGWTKVASLDRRPAAQTIDARHRRAARTATTWSGSRSCRRGEQRATISELALLSRSG